MLILSLRLLRTSRLILSSSRTLIIAPHFRKSLILKKEVACANPKTIVKFQQSSSAGSFGSREFGEVCEETLDSLAEYFEELVETIPSLKNGDIAYSDGVITASLGSTFGTYVINRQTPNRQIWLSSPTSGPKRYEFVDGIWIYKHDNTTLHSLLDREISEIVKNKVEFSTNCLYGSKKL